MTLINAKMEGRLFTARGHAKVMREANRGATNFWVKNSLPLHFQLNERTRPGGVYGYEKRSKRTQIRKANKFHHQRPNVQTGNLERTIRNNSRITATQRVSRFRGKAPFPLTAQRRRELEIVAPDEAAAMIAEAKRIYLDAANDPANKDIIRQQRARDSSGRFIRN